MKLEGKKELASRTLNVGKGRIIFNAERLDEIKEALTKQDIRDLNQSGAIIIREIKGTKTKPKRKTRRKHGSIKIRVNTRKRDYMMLTRKLRAYAAELRTKKIITDDEFYEIRKEIRSKLFRSKAHMKEKIMQMTKEKK